MEARMISESLADILERKIKYYLQHDNPNPKKSSLFDTVFTFISGSGYEGRVRAKKYLRKVVRGNDNAQELLKKVYADCVPSNQKTLGSSIKLKIRLLEGICEFNKVGSEEIYKLTHIMLLSATGYPGVQHASLSMNQMNAIRLNALYLVAERSMSKQPQENITFKYGAYNSSL